MRLAAVTERLFLAAGGVALAGAVISRTIGAEIIKDVSAGFRSSPAGNVSSSPSASGGGQSAGSTPTATATATPTPTPAPTPATVTIPVPVYQQSMVLDCETAALQQGPPYSGINVSQSELFAAEDADVRLPVMGPNHTVLRWGNPYTNFVGYVNGSDGTPTGYGVYWPVILRVAQTHGLPNAIGGEGFSPSRFYRELPAGHPGQAGL